MKNILSCQTFAAIIGVCYLLIITTSALETIRSMLIKQISYLQENLLFFSAHWIKFKKYKGNVTKTDHRKKVCVRTEWRCAKRSRLVSFRVRRKMTGDVIVFMPMGHHSSNVSEKFHPDVFHIFVPSVLILQIRADRVTENRPHYSKVIIGDPSMSMELAQVQ